MNAIFVTGTDTGVGKTVITGLIARYFKDKGSNVITQKWIQTGCNRKVPADIKSHLKFMGTDTDEIKNYLSCACPYSFKTPCSAHLASKIENKKIDIENIKKSFRALTKSFDFVAVEGTGGTLVPVDNSHLIIDIAKGLKLKVVLVAQNKLGAINQTLLAVEALEKRKIEILGIIFNNLPQADPRILKDNPKIIKIITKQKILGVLPFCNDYGRLYASFLPIGNRLWKEIGLKKI